MLNEKLSTLCCSIVYSGSSIAGTARFSSGGDLSKFSTLPYLRFHIQRTEADGHVMWRMPCSSCTSFVF